MFLREVGGRITKISLDYSNNPLFYVKSFGSLNNIGGKVFEIKRQSRNSYFTFGGGKGMRDHDRGKDNRELTLRMLQRTSMPG